MLVRANDLYNAMSFLRRKMPTILSGRKNEMLFFVGESANREFGWMKGIQSSMLRPIWSRSSRVNMKKAYFLMKKNGEIR